MGDSDTLPWGGQAGMGTGQDARRWEGGATSPKQRDHGSPRRVWFIPAPGSPRHQSLSVPTPSRDRSFHPLARVRTHWGPILPRLQICRGKDWQARAGMDPAGYRALAAAYLRASR